MQTGGSAAYVFGVRSVGQEPLRRALGERHRQSSCVNMAAKLGVHGRVPELRVHLGVLFRTTHLRQHLPSLASYPSLSPPPQTTQKISSSRAVHNQLAGGSHAQVQISLQTNHSFNNIAGRLLTSSYHQQRSPQTPT